MIIRQIYTRTGVNDDGVLLIKMMEGIVYHTLHISAVVKCNLRIVCLFSLYSLHSFMVLSTLPCPYLDVIHNHTFHSLIKNIMNTTQPN